MLRSAKDDSMYHLYCGEALAGANRRVEVRLPRLLAAGCAPVAERGVRPSQSGQAVRRIVFNAPRCSQRRGCELLVLVGRGAVRWVDSASEMRARKDGLWKKERDSTCHLWVRSASWSSTSSLPWTTTPRPSASGRG